MPNQRVIATFLLAGLIAGCAPQSGSTTVAATPTAQLGIEQTPAMTETPTTQPGGVITLMVWLPPEFDTAGGNLAANMLQDRLAEFAVTHPQVRIETRVKADEGTGGLLDSLLAAQAAAPLAEPDLILLPHIQLQQAAQSGVVYPLEGLTTEQNSQDWYSFARQMIQVGGKDYGLPFAADALVVSFRPTAVTSVPHNWSAFLESRRSLGLAVADPLAQFSLAELFALHSEQDQSGKPFSQDELIQLFEFYARAQELGVFPYWLTQYQTYEQSWQAFTEGRVPMVVGWISRNFDSRNVDVNGAPLPTENGDAFTVVKGWVWAITTPYAERRSLAAELAEHLITPEFLAQWSAAAGMLPPRASSLAAWSPDSRQALASQIISDAVALPPQSTLDLWGQPLADAMVAILKQEETPEEAAQAVLTAIANPQ